MVAQAPLSSYKACARITTTESLKHLPVRPFVFLTLDFDRLVPAPLVLDKLLVLCRVELGELIGFVVWGNVKSWQGFVSANQEDALDDGIVADAENRGAAEKVFARRFEAGKKSTYKTFISVILSYHKVWEYYQ